MPVADRLGAEGDGLRRAESLTVGDSRFLPPVWAISNNV